MSEFLCFLKDNWISLLVLIIALLALVVSFIANRFQIVSLLSSQLAEKAKECNSYLSPQHVDLFPDSKKKISGILTSIITSEELLYLRLKKWNRYFGRKQWRYNLFAWRINEQILINYFYLQLHSTIRLYLKRHSHVGIHPDDRQRDPEGCNTIDIQYQRVRSFLWISMVNCDNKLFAALHQHTLYRNQKSKITSIHKVRPENLYSTEEQETKK